MTARFFIMGFALTLAGILFPAVAVAQTPAAISYGSAYGSIAATENSLLSGANPGPFAPIYLAQNSSPTTTSPVSDIPVTLPPANSSVILPPFDPYAVSRQTSPFGAVFPISNSSGLGQAAPSNIYSGNFDRFVPETRKAIQRFRDGTSFEYTHLPRSGNNARSFGMDEIDLRMQLAFPCRFVPNNGQTGYFYAAPAGSLVWWNGPASPAMSPNGFGAYLDFGVKPKFNEVFSLNAWGRVGLFSDFKNVSSDALRYQGRLEGSGILSSQMEVRAGVVYYGRARVKILPTVGVVWTPDENWTLRLVFPNPKVSRRLWTGPQADWWGYVNMDYAGGSWDIKGLGLTDYNDIRLGMGVEFATPNRIGGYFEFGGSFDRELYSGGHRLVNAPSVLYLKTGVIF